MKSIIFLVLLFWLFLQLFMHVQFLRKQKFILRQIIQVLKSPLVKDDGEFEVEFKESGKNMSCSYDKGGMLLETETEITIQELPAHIKEAVNKAYPNYNIEDIEEVSIPNAGIQYEMELELGKIEFEVLVSGDGTSITKKSD